MKKMKGRGSNWSVDDIATTVVGIIYIGMVLFGVVMTLTGSSDFSSKIMAALVGVTFLVIIISSIAVEHRFKLKNSRQFVMSIDTAAGHDITKIDESGYVTMTYYGHQYRYKYIRTIYKDFTWAENHHTCHRRAYYYILEKETDSQPPYYGHMAEMREKELKKKT